MKKEKEKKIIRTSQKKTDIITASTFKSAFDDDIDTDPQGSWTGVRTDDPYDKPIQDADDL